MGRDGAGRALFSPLSGGVARRAFPLAGLWEGGIQGVFPEGTHVELEQAWGRERESMQAKMVKEERRKSQLPAPDPL